jgi:uncharacterized BrkB/YihY/UPF0761 family membrane protein
MPVNPFDGRINKTSDILTISAASVVLSGGGIMLAVLVDKQFAALSKRYPQSTVPLAYLQVFVCALMLAFLYLLGPTSVVLHFQRSLPGLIFPGMFFNVQSNVFDTFQAMRLPTI